MQVLNNMSQWNLFLDNFPKSEEGRKSFKPQREVVGWKQEGLEEILSVVITKEETKQEKEATKGSFFLCKAALYDAWH